MEWRTTWLELTSAWEPASATCLWILTWVPTDCPGGGEQSLKSPPSRLSNKGANKSAITAEIPNWPRHLRQLQLYSSGPPCAMTSLTSPPKLTLPLMEGKNGRGSNGGNDKTSLPGSRVSFLWDLWWEEQTIWGRPFYVWVRGQPAIKPLRKGEGGFSQVGGQIPTDCRLIPGWLWPRVGEKNKKNFYRFVL